MRRRGFTLLEVVLAVLILGGSAAIIAGGVGAIERSSVRDKVRLEAAEVAHRIILNYLKDPGTLPDNSLPIEQGSGLYRYLLSEEMLVEEGVVDGVSVRVPKPTDQISENERLGSQLVVITVKVYEHNDGRAIGGEPLAVIRRIFSPLHYRSDDTDVLFNHIKRMMPNIAIPQK